MERVNNMIRIPDELQPYIDFDDGNVIARDLPDELEEDFKDFQKMYQDLKTNPDYKYTDL